MRCDRTTCYIAEYFVGEVAHDARTRDEDQTHRRSRRDWGAGPGLRGMARQIRTAADAWYFEVLQPSPGLSARSYEVQRYRALLPRTPRPQNQGSDCEL